MSSDLVLFSELIYDVLSGTREFNRTTAYSSNTNIDWFINALEEAGREAGIARCGDEALCLGDALMVFAVEALITPDRRGLADVAVEQLHVNGVEVGRVTQSHEHVLAFAGSTTDAWLEGRILASRGWVLLVSAPTELGTSDLVRILDDQIAKIEGPAQT